MKVLFVTRGYPSKDDLMNGNYESVQAKALVKKGVDVSLLCIKSRSIIHIFDKTNIVSFEDEGVHVYQINVALLIIPKMWFLRKTRFNDWIIKRAFYKLYINYCHEQGKPDIVHAHIIFCAARTSFLKDVFHLPFVITEHWSMMIKENVPDWLQNFSQIYYKADALICVSQALADSLKKHFKVDSTIINNMVSDKFFNTAKVVRCDNIFRFVACGAFRENRLKGFDILVDAFASAQLPENVCLDIIGDGPDRPYIESKIEDNHLTNQIRLLGVKTPDEVSDLLCNSDCFVLSSRLETFSIVVIEAMAKGLPVIATRCGGPEAFLRPEHGKLIEKENVKELADAMNFMVEHHSDYNSEDIRKYCYNHFSQDVIADQIIGVYNKVLNNH